MDILFWLNVVQLGSDAEIIKQNITLSSFNIVYNGHSLFHYFAENVEVMDLLNDKFMMAFNQGKLKDSERNAPLTLLHPNPDGKTALDIAMEEHRPRCLEVMIELLSCYPKYMLSKMMLPVVPHMIDNATGTVLNFYSSAIFKPSLMEIPMNIPWPDDTD